MIGNDFPPTVSHVPLNINSAVSDADIYAWMETVFVDTFFCDEPGDYVAGQCKTNDGRFVQMSPFRIRTLRVKPGPCDGDVSVLKGWADANLTCSPFFLPSTEDKAAWVVGNQTLQWQEPVYRQQGSTTTYHPGLTIWGEFANYHQVA